ncbi:hypothetical protein F4859DRAFT_473725 [Xylaria cf. heliscus]|nr:hypothetical protein F4859DRAFT_473725 [Xylaria cf. heliscus]
MTSSPPPQPPRSPLVRLPWELSALIYSYLSNRDIKNLRLVSSFFERTAPLRLDRVFISANPRNIEVFEAISQHEVYRAQITEIVWDDALLASTRLEHDTGAIHDVFLDEYDDSPEREPCPEWYNDACEENLHSWRSILLSSWRKSHSPPREPQFGVALMSPGDSWAYYQGLLRQQREVLASQAHIRALESRIGCFPALQKITVTGVAHGRLFTPVYETPMIRSFPDGFNYAIPSWMVYKCMHPECPEWVEEGGRWEGFRVAIDALARNLDGGKVRELQVNSFQLLTGLNSRLFEAPCQTLSNLQTVLGRPNFESLHLDLMAEEHDLQADVFNHALLKRVLAGAAGGQGLKRLTLGTDNGEARWNVPLETIYGPSSLQRLEHFSLSRFPVKEKDLVALLARLPLSIRTIELCSLNFLEGNYQSLLNQIRDTLGWQDRNPRPLMSIGADTNFDHPGVTIWTENEVYSFLYEGGPNPFGNDPALIWSLGHGSGIGVIKDALGSQNQWPNLSHQRMVEAGYVKDLRYDDVARRAYDKN